MSDFISYCHLEINVLFHAATFHYKELGLTGHSYATDHCFDQYFIIVKKMFNF